MDINNLSLDEQIKFINDKLSMEKDKSVTKIFKEYGINKSKFQNKLKGYEFNIDQRRYIKIDRNIHNKGSKDDIKIDKKIYTDILELISMKDKLKELILIEDEKKMNVKINKFEGELKAKSVKIYVDVLNEFNTFMDEHKELKQQDVVSQAIFEFLKKNK